MPSATTANSSTVEEIRISGTATAIESRPKPQVETVGVNHLIVAPKSLHDSTVGAFTRALFTVRPTLVREYPGASKIEKPDTDKDAAIPAHAGAAAYIEGNERTFLDRYSDYFWGAILLFSVLGSTMSGASLTSASAARTYVTAGMRMVQQIMPLPRCNVAAGWPFIRLGQHHRRH